MTPSEAIKRFVADEISYRKFSGFVYSSCYHDDTDETLSECFLLCSEYDRGHWTEVGFRDELSKLLSLEEKPCKTSAT